MKRLVSAFFAKNSNPLKSISTSSSAPVIGNIGISPVVTPVPSITPLKVLNSKSKPHPLPSYPTLPPVVRKGERRSEYNALLASVVQVATRDTDLVSELSVKRVLSKNGEMKKVIVKMAAMALAQSEEVNSPNDLHPFITTAGEVFFGSDYANLEEGDDEPIIQDLLTPGLLVLLLNNLMCPQNKDAQIIYKRQLLLARALVETCAGYLLHRTVLEVQDCIEVPQGPLERLHQGNKLATLTGDLLVVSLIRNVATTKNNQVLQQIMEGLSEFSTTEIAKLKPFETVQGQGHVRALLPSTLAESIVLSKGFASALLILGTEDQEKLEWGQMLGNVLGLLWKNNFDHVKLKGQRVDNLEAYNSYLGRLRGEVETLIGNCTDKEEAKVIRQLAQFWGRDKQ